MIVALPVGHDHLATALVRDLGFTKVHVDHAVRDLLTEIDPFVEAGVQLANIGRSPRLSSRLASHDGDWDRAAQRAPEIIRLLDVLRPYVFSSQEFDDGDVVLVGVTPASLDTLPADTVLVAIEGRWDDANRAADRIIADAPIVDQEVAVVAFVRPPKTKAKPQPVLVPAVDNDDDEYSE